MNIWMHSWYLALIVMHSKLPGPCLLCKSVACVSHNLLATTLVLVKLQFDESHQGDQNPKQILCLRWWSDGRCLQTQKANVIQLFQLNVYLQNLWFSYDLCTPLKKISLLAHVLNPNSKHGTSIFCIPLFYNWVNRGEKDREAEEIGANCSSSCTWLYLPGSWALAVTLTD